MTLSIEELLRGAELPEDSVQLCLKGSLRRRYEDLEREMATAASVASNLGERAPATVIADQLLLLREEMRPWTPTFLLRALPPKPWREYLALMPGDPKNDAERGTWDERYHAWVCEMVALTCYDPVMTAEQVDELHGKVSGGQWKDLTNAVYALNAERQNVPFSAAASAMIASTAQSLRRPDPGASATPAGSGKSRAKSRRTSTTTTPAA